MPAKQLRSAANADGRLEVFFTGLDDVIYHSLQMAPGGWTGSNRAILLAAPTNKAKQIAVGQNNDGRLEIFYIGTDNVLSHDWQMAKGSR